MAINKRHVSFVSRTFQPRSTLKSTRFLPLVASLFLFVLFRSGCRANQPAAGTGLAPLRLQLDWYPQPEHGGFYTAQMLGYYKAEGLNVTISPLPQYGSVAQIVATGRADIGLGSSDQILEWNSNAQIGRASCRER